MLPVQDKQMFFLIYLNCTYRIPQQDSVGTNKGFWGPLVFGSVADGIQSDYQSCGAYNRNNKLVTPTHI